MKEKKNGREGRERPRGAGDGGKKRGEPRSPLGPGPAGSDPEAPPRPKAPPEGLTLASFTMMAAVPGGAGAAAELLRGAGVCVPGGVTAGNGAGPGSGGAALPMQTGD